MSCDEEADMHWTRRDRMVWQQTFSVREESIGHRGVNGGVEWGLTLDIARRFFLFFSFFSAFFLVLVPFFFDWQSWECHTHLSECICVLCLWILEFVIRIDVQRDGAKWMMRVWRRRGEDQIFVDTSLIKSAWALFMSFSFRSFHELYFYIQLKWLLTFSFYRFSRIRTVARRECFFLDSTGVPVNSLRIRFPSVPVSVTASSMHLSLQIYLCLKFCAEIPSLDAFL